MAIEFKDRVSHFLTEENFTIVSQTANEIIADVDRAGVQF